MGNCKGYGACLVKISAVYLVIGLVAGLYVAIAKVYPLATVHSHLALAGWGSMCLAGLVYIVRPSCDSNRLASAHFWLHNVGLLVMIVSLAIYKLGNESAEKALGIGSMLLLAGLAVFAVNVLKNLDA